MNLAALAGEETDRSLAIAYTDAAEAALKATEAEEDSYGAYKDRMFPWDIAVHSMQALREALQGAWLALAAAEAGYDADYPRALGCLSGALGRLATALIAVGLELPQELEYAIAISEHYAETLCAES